MTKTVPWQRGVGLHSGRRVAARVIPGGGQITVRRVDLTERQEWPVRLDCARTTGRQTCIGQPERAVGTVEHLLSALFALGIVEATIEVDGGELPILDGSALDWVERLQAASRSVVRDPAVYWRVGRPVERRRGSALCSLQPSEGGLSVDCTIAFDHEAIGRQRRVWRATTLASYLADVAPARTFGMLAEAKELRARGLAIGASLDNTVVFGDECVLNAEGLRFPDEPVRHKILDALGDLALLGAPLVGELRLERCSHALLVETLRDGQLSGGLELCTS